MHLPKRDIVATCAVAAAVVLYVLWLLDATLPGMSSVRVTGLVILALGFVASAVAVVPSFQQLLHGDKGYLAVTSLLGLVALGAGIVMLWAASEVALGVLMAALAVLWVISTAHHVLLARAERSTSHGEAVPPTGSGRHAHVG